MIHREILKKLSPITDEEQAILDGRRDIDRDLYISSGGGNVIEAEKLLEKGKLITIRPHTRFVHFPQHTHNYVEVVYMCQGRTVHYVNGTRIELKEGELLFLGQGATQEIEPAAESDIAVNFIILPPFFDRTIEMISEREAPLRRFLVECLNGAAGSPGYLYFKVSDVLPVQNLVENLLWTMFSDVPNKRSVNQMTMGLLFTHLVNQSERLSYESKEEESILQVFRYIEDHYRDGSLAELAERMHYDFYWLSRQIKRRTGKTYTELVREKRLSQAAYLLQNTSLHVDRIGEMVGYSNMSFFHDIFQKEFGMTPKKYRDQQQEKQKNA